MTKTLLLHVGLQKTGTTYLQRHVFPNMDGAGYMHKPQVLKRCFTVSPAVWTQDHLGDELAVALKVSTADAQKVLIASDENLAAPRFFPFHELKTADHRSYNRQDPYLLAEHLRRLCMFVSERLDRELRILVTIRRQDLLLASLYAQSSRSLYSSQKDFEREIEALVDPHRRYYLHGLWLDFAMLHDIIGTAVGRNNVCLLPQELLEEQPQVFIDHLATFAGFAEPPVPDAESGHRTSPSIRNNVRQSSADTWRLRGPSLHVLPQFLARALGVDAKLTLRPPGRRTITVDEHVRRVVLDHYRMANEALDRDCPINLARYGYYS